ncbi:cytochrome oxidase assembly protein 1 [Vermiconidia calcicola]|uniref:Cytochrome oxidase assembly protein 1 n=1 Tax=Vermiconidia calcicola TaxID=1690605 RepID=A0ACC3ML94_9PEZI|nr:cytochrome oxidase assembly protein 1 [Vermiconidia calcicola]
MLPRPRIWPNGLRKLFQSHVTSKRSIIAAPRPGSGPLMERRSDRALPSVSSTNFRWLRTLPIFAVIMVASTLGIFNYQKQSSSVVSSTLYALRTNPEARQILGDEVYFASQIPWISGEINQLHGRINISFWVKGTNGRGLMRFKSERKTRMGYFETLEWSLEPEGGKKISLLENQGRDPFQQETADKIAVAA